MHQAEKKKFLKVSLIVTLLLSMVIMTACKREEPTVWRVDALFPIAQGKVSFANLIQDQEDYFELDDEGLMHLIYKDTIQALDLDTLVQLPDTNITNSFSLPFAGGPFSVPAGNELYTDNTNIQFNINNVELREAQLSSGFLYYELISEIDGELSIQLDLPGAVKNGESLSLEVISTPGSSLNPFVETGFIDLSGFEIDLRGDQGNEFNKINSIYAVSVYELASQNAEVYGDDLVSVKLSFIDANVSFARGFFGNDIYDLSENVELENLSEILSGSAIQLEQIELQLELNNHVGVDAQVLINGLEAQREGQISTALDHNIIGSPINITRASMLNPAPNVLSTTNTFVFDQDNSNVLDFIGMVPHNIQVDAALNMNPLGDISGGNDFIYTDNTIDLILGLDLPLCVGVDGLTLSDTLFIEDNLEDLPESSGDIHLYLENRFPLGGEIQLYITHPEGDLFVSEGIFEPGIQDPLSSLVSPVSSQVSIHLEREEFELLRNGAQFIMSVTLLGGNQQMKISGEEELKAKIVADINTSISVE